jgi:hypothetical protein
MRPYYERATELFNQGIRSATQIARKLIEEGVTQEPFNRVRRNVSYRVVEKDNLLSKECETLGIPIENVKHYWHKGKHFSINVGKNDSLSYDDLKESIIEDMRSHSPSYPVIERVDYGDAGYLLVVDPADVHIGKLASSFETGEEYNSQIAVARVKEGVKGIVNKCSGFKIDKILFIGGNDILHIDTPKRTTTSGTPQDTDGMWYDNFLIAKQLYIDIIEMLVSIADVHFVFNPSNHDYTNGFFLADVIQSWFRNCEHVTFDCSIAHRKYYRYYNNLIGTTHGDGAKNADLPLLMAHEYPQGWAICKHRYIYTHHVHHKTSKDYIGVTVESLRSPSGTDSWHSRNGYTGSPKAIEGFLHCKQNGQVARITHLF